VGRHSVAGYVEHLFEMLAIDLVLDVEANGRQDRDFCSMKSATVDGLLLSNPILCLPGSPAIVPTSKSDVYRGFRNAHLRKTHQTTLQRFARYSSTALSRVDSFRT
jgi:hypothetical protein